MKAATFSRRSLNPDMHLATLQMKEWLADIQALNSPNGYLTALIATS